MKISIEEKKFTVFNLLPAAAGPIPALRRQLLPTPALLLFPPAWRPG